MRNRFLKSVISVILVLSLFTGILPLQVISLSTDSSENETIELVQAPATIVGEEVSLRTETEKHFRLSDGSYIAVSYGMPVHYRDDAGNWEDIDNTLTFSANQSAYVAGNAQIATAFSADLSSGKMLTSSYNGKTVSMYLLNNSQAQMMVADSIATFQPSNLQAYDETVEASVLSTDGASSSSVLEDSSNAQGWSAEDLIPEKLQSSVLYEDVYPGVDFLYTAWGHNIKEQIIVNEPQSQYCYSFFLVLQDLTAVLNEDGSISLLNAAEEPVYTIPAPYMEDGAGLTSNSVVYTLQQVSGGAVLTVEADSDWINDEKRVFPVSIDPTLKVDAGSQEDDIYITYIDEGSPSATHMSDQHIYFGYGYHDTVKERRIFMHFNNLPEIPAGSVITNAQFSMYMFSLSYQGCAELGAALYAVTEDKGSYASYYDWMCQFCWNTQPTYDTSNMIDYTVIDGTQSNGNLYRSYYWDMTELVKEWYKTGTENRTAALAITPGTTAYGPSYCSVPVFMAYGDTHPPIMIVSYRSNTGIEDYYSYATLGSGEAGTAYIADATGQLKIAKRLISYSSVINPFAMSLVYNSDYFSANATASYQSPEKLGLSMRLGEGWTLDVIQKVETYDIDPQYLKYTDGDGTVHYFYDDPNDSYEGIYFDEDGLGLQITASSSTTYTMSDLQDNTYTFTDGFLTNIKDNVGNEYIINYASEKITSIKQKNKGYSEITVASFAYSDDYVSSITDAAGIVYSLTYDSSNRLASISMSGDVIAQYSYSQHRVIVMTDVENTYALHYNYNSDGKISRFYETGATSVLGAQVDVTYDGYDKTTYQDYGNDRTKNTADDIITHYLFDYAGRTANAYSTDYYGNIIGATNAVYTGTGSADKDNNRVKRTASIGIAAQQALLDGGFETTSNSWNISSAFQISTSNPRTGTYSLECPLGSALLVESATNSSLQLLAGKTYTLSAYVNTSNVSFANKALIWLTVIHGENEWSGNSMAYQTSETVDDGWVRISVTFTAQTTASHTIGISVSGGSGTLYVDDFQLEAAEAPSTYNILENGSFAGGSKGWAFGSNGSYALSSGMSQSIAPVIPSSPLNGNANISQTVAVNLPGAETYVLSGWAKGNAVPDNEDSVADPTQDTVKAFGLRAILTYSDTTTEYHYVPFNADIADWQFTSLTIVPGYPDKTVATITVVCAYERNGNSAVFDNISLMRQKAQCMSYDDNGFLTSVSTTGITADTHTYEDGNLTSTATGIGGTINYTYDSTYTHRLTSYTNGLVTNSLSYTSVGNVVSTTLSASSSSYVLRSSSTYTNAGNLVASVTNLDRIKTTYQYSSAFNEMLGLPSLIKDANQTATSIFYDNFGRTTETEVASLARLCYYYSNGNLTEISRSASSNTQEYCFTYDAFGNVTSMKIGTQLIASYTYGSRNGQLLTQTYANGDTVTFTYDILSRVKTATYDDGRVVTYTYNGEGQLFSAVETDGTSSVAYFYTYDMEGRLIASEKKEGNVVTVRVYLQYNAAGKLIAQSWTVAGTTYSERYLYNTADGAIASMSTAGQRLRMTYDGLRRISSIAASIYTKSYTYRNYSATQTTTQVSGLSYSGLSAAPSFGYTYNAVGNIATCTMPDGEVITYTYDALGQLLSAVGDATYTYTYDNAGNILTANGHTYTYGNANWKDLLTAFDGQSITYDASGNPLSYYNGTRWTFTWENGRNLATATDGTTSVSYTYDTSGLRTGKTVGSVVHKYYYAGGTLLRETYGSNILDFAYDAQGYPFALIYNGTTYYYVTNLQGDVMYLVDSSGATVASYEYDPYGNILSAIGPLAEINPLRYRGYYYDADTGFYYLQSRYYDPTVGRFLNADIYASTGQGALGFNMFAYCRNNPVNRVDASGTSDLCYDNNEDDGNPLNDFGPVRGGGGGASGGNSGTGGVSGNSSYGYSTPPGGGGVSSQVVVGDITVEFGHGGRHVDFPDISGLENAIANDVVTKPPTTGQSIPVDICYSGTWFTYRYFTITPTRINVGTYFYKIC